jgi:hypothetical protein
VGGWYNYDIYMKRGEARRLLGLLGRGRGRGRRVVDQQSISCTYLLHAIVLGGAGGRKGTGLGQVVCVGGSKR